MTETDTQESTTDLIVLPHKSDVPALFKTKDGIRDLVERIKKDARSYAFDITKAKGRKECTSVAARVSRSKTLIDEVGKEENEERNRLNKEVNELRNYAKAELDALRDEIKAPVLAWEQKEADRVRAHMQRMDKFHLARATAMDDTPTIMGIISDIGAVEIDATWEEFEADAKTAKAAALDKFNADLRIAQAREDQAAELEALRAAQAKREREDQERAEKEAAAKIEQEREARAAEQAKAAAAEAEAKAKADAEAAEARHKADLAAAEQRAADAAQAERDLAAKAKADEEAAQAARAADKKHRQKIRAEAVASIVAAKPANWEELVDMILAGEISHLRVMI